MTQPPLTLAEIQLLAAAGGTAPSLHNSQPWRFRPTSDARGLRVYADPARAVPVTDPDGRALRISVGAAVFNLRVAADHLGREAVSRLLPDPADPLLLAMLDLSAPARVDRRYPPVLYRALERRHSSRLPFAERHVPDAVIGELVSAAAEEGAMLALLAEDGARRVLALTGEAERRTASDLAREAETRAWLRLEQSAADGIPEAALGPQDYDARVPVRSFSGHPPTTSVAARRFEALPRIAVLATHADRPEDWLRAGQALQHAWLCATVHGVRASVLHQAVEFPDTRWQLRDPAEGPGHVQLLLRLGYGPAGAPTPRRPVAETLDLTGLTDPVELMERQEPVE